MSNDLSDRPTLARRQLGAELRKLREAAGLGPSEAGELVDLHRNTITAIEKGKQGTKPYVVKALCKDAYNASPEVMSYLTGLVVKGKQRGLYEKNEPGMRQGLQWFAAAEAEYGVIMTWEPLNIPGLLQVPEYYDEQRRTWENLRPMDEEEERAMKAFRFKRQRVVLERDSPPKMQFVIGEGALGLLDGFPQVKGAQIARLLDLAKSPAIDIRVATGLHSAMTGAFTILSPGLDATDELSFVYMDTLDACRYIEDPDVVSRFVGTFRIVYDMAISIKEYVK